MIYQIKPDTQSFETAYCENTYKYIGTNIVKNRYPLKLNKFLY